MLIIIFSFPLSLSPFSPFLPFPPACRREGEKISMKKFLLDLFFPKFCLGCGYEGDYLCPDCRSLIDVNYYHFCPICNCRVLDGRTCLKCRSKTDLTGLFWAVNYQTPLVKKLFSFLKYEARAKDISKVLADFVIDSFSRFQTTILPLSPSPLSPLSPLLPLSALSGRTKGEFVLIPVPLHKKKLKDRGFNQAEEIAKYLAEAWKITLLSDVLIKTRKTESQTKLSKEQREKNVREAFRLREPPSFAHQRKGGSEIIQGKKVLLVDDVYTTGSTMNECARVLKEAGAKQVWGIAVARE